MQDIEKSRIAMARCVEKVIHIHKRSQASPSDHQLVSENQNDYIQNTVAESNLSEIIS